MHQYANIVKPGGEGFLNLTLYSESQTLYGKKVWHMSSPPNNHINIAMISLRWKSFAQISNTNYKFQIILDLDFMVLTIGFELVLSKCYINLLQKRF